MAAPDRLQALHMQSVKLLTGIDFVYVAPDQTNLYVFFLIPPGSLVPSLVDDLSADAITITSLSEASTLPEVPVQSVAWPVRDGQRVLHITTTEPGDFSRYALHIEDPRVDRYFNDTPFSFKANCESDLDCAPEDAACPDEEAPEVPIDYQARDFWSFRTALLDFASLRYPDWQDRLEADTGVMLAEAMSAVADEMAYYQDRIAREAFLSTATQRRSIRRHARLVDYEIHDGLAAWTWLTVTVASGSASIPAGTDAWATSDAGAQIDYEIGRGLSEIGRDPTETKVYTALETLNALTAHLWDEDETCLAVGATEVYVVNQVASDLMPSSASEKWVLLRTDPSLASTPEGQTAPARALMVRLVSAEDDTDTLLNVPVTKLVWDDDQALPFELDLETLRVHGNMIPATAGKTYEARFTIGASTDEASPSAVERTGPNGTTAYLFSLPDSETTDLSWVGDDTASATPEIRLEQLDSTGAFVKEWEWQRSLLGSPSSVSTDTHFTLDDGVYGQVVSYWRGGSEPVRHIDYRKGEGFTIRFGDGVFGRAPSAAPFEVTYRLGNGSSGNVPAHAITSIDFTGVTVDNALAVSTGVDPESADDVKQLAPEAYKAVTYRAVRPEDYAEAAERLSWVQRAGASFRWTGSWLTAFVTPDPEGTVTLSDDRRVELEQQLDRFRQAGRDTCVLDPAYAWLDLRITVCVEPTSFRGDVKERVLSLLTDDGGFFDPDNFTFGTPLRRSTLEAAIQGVPGVRAVEGVSIRRRGWTAWQPLDDSTSELQVGPDEVIGVENDPLYPERGSITLVMDGGA